MSVKANALRKSLSARDLLTDKFGNLMLLLRGYGVFTFDNKAQEFSEGSQFR